jgi:hypothetical protein
VKLKGSQIQDKA